MRAIQLALACMVVLVNLAGEAQAGPLTFTFQRIADINTPIPGRTGNFSELSVPSLDGNNVAFVGRDSGGARGIYLNTDSSGLTVVADGNTPVTGGTGNFDTGLFDLNNPSVDGSNVAFSGRGSGVQTGIYKTDGGSLGVVADRNTAIPGGTGNFGDAGFGLGFGRSVSMDGGNVAFVGGTGLAGTVYGIYTEIGGSLSLVADGDTPVPGGSPFAEFRTFFSPSLSGGNVVFLADIGGTRAIFSDVGGLHRVVDASVVIPNGIFGRTFSNFGSPSMDNGSVAFFGRDQFSFLQGIYVDTNGILDVVANNYTAIPDGTGTFTDFFAPSLDNGSVAFVGRGSGGQRGIYTNIGGTLDNVIDLGDSLDGKTVDGLFLGQEGLSGNSIAFLATFTDGSSGVFTGSGPEIETPAVPEPTSLALLATGAFGCMGYGWRRKRKLAA